MRTKIDGKYWDLVYVKLPRSVDGECDRPDQKGKQIKISRSVLRNDQRHLEALLHEVLHAVAWPLDEEYVAAFARDAARLVIKRGFRSHGKEENND